MSKISSIAGPLSIETLNAAHSAVHQLLSIPHPEVPNLTLWMMGDDHVLMRILSEELGFYVSILQSDSHRDDLRCKATGILRRISRRYHLDRSCGAVETMSINDQALLHPDSYNHQTGVLKAA